MHIVLIILLPTEEVASNDNSFLCYLLKTFRYPYISSASGVAFLITLQWTCA